MKSNIDKYCLANAKIKELNEVEKEALMADLIGSYIYKSKCCCLDLLIEGNMDEFAYHVDQMNTVGKQILDVMKDVKKTDLF